MRANGSRTILTSANHLSAREWDSRGDHCPVAVGLSGRISVGVDGVGGVVGDEVGPERSE